MKKLTLAAVFVFAAFLAAPLASEAGGGRGHHGGHHHHVRSRVVVGFGVGPYWGWGYGYPYWGSPYWYYPPAYAPVVVQESPPVYVQQPAPVAPAPPAPAEQYWYYCESVRGYYPSVPNCPEQWLKVAPRP